MTFLERRTQLEVLFKGSGITWSGYHASWLIAAPDLNPDFRLINPDIMESLLRVGQMELPRLLTLPNALLCESLANLCPASDYFLRRISDSYTDYAIRPLLCTLLSTGGPV